MERSAVALLSRVICYYYLVCFEKIIPITNVTNSHKIMNNNNNKSKIETMVQTEENNPSSMPSSTSLIG